VAKPLYTAAQRFDPSSESWSKYIAWRKLPQLREVVSLDQSLCPNLFLELMPQDWEHNVNADFRTHFFYDLDYVVRRAEGKPVNVLAIAEEPTASDVVSIQDSRFELCGFDLLDETFDISSLTNCMGFERALRDDDISEQGLITDYGRACDVRDQLRREYPDESHAHCRMFAVWRLRG
jgi:hypothetical protein